MLTRTRPGVFVAECDTCLRRVVLGLVTRVVAEHDLADQRWRRLKTPHGRSPEQDHWRCPQCLTTPPTR